MTHFFIGLYTYFERHKITFYLSLIGSVILMAFFARQVRFEEDVTRFFPDTKGSENMVQVFNNLNINNKIVVMVSAKDSTSETDAEHLIEVADSLQQEIVKEAQPTLIKEVFAEADSRLIQQTTDFIYQYLPLFLTESDYARMDSLLTEEAIDSVMKKNYTNLISPTGFALKPFILKDPLGLGSSSLKQLQQFQLEANYDLINDHIFSKDGRTLLMFITPVYNTGNTQKNDALVSLLENRFEQLESEHPDLAVSYFGGPSVGVYNARQIKQDTILTSCIALAVIMLFISLVFKRKRSIPLIITPVLFGGLFALFLIYFIKGNISAIAVGAGSAVMGIALSYSIHMLAHQNHVSSIEQLIKELAYPLTVGSFTTIGAFWGLTFTSSDLLRDFGLFASLALIGTTLFCLIYMPHFLKGQAHVPQGAVLRLIEKINAYSFERNKWLVAGLILLIPIGLYTAQKVKFNNDMMTLNYEPDHLKKAEQKLTAIFEQKEKTVLFVTVGKNMDEATQHYRETNALLTKLQSKGEIKGMASAGYFLVPPHVQEERLKRWQTYWNADKKASLNKHLQTAAAHYHFREGSFNAFFQWFDAPFQTLNYQSDQAGVSSKLLNEWQTTTDSLTMLITQVRLNQALKEQVYQHFKENDEVVVFDRAYFANKWVSSINQDFYLILYLSSFLIFFALWISYGRIELTLMSFLPMFVSWIIIVGLMGLFHIEFNIVNIILSTFIFGIGDDFSIFIMDGLQNNYRTGKRVLNSHKTAIFFSAFTTVVGMGALCFAQHPALQSISLISILGLITVVLVAYTLQPLIFHFFISRPAAKGLPPYTLIGLIRTAGLFTLFVVGCLLLRLLIALLLLIPIRKRTKKQVICKLIQLTCKSILYIATFVKKETINEAQERFQKPAILVANHQSFIDILVLLSLTPKLVMITNRWVWNSPVFGAIIRYVDFYPVDEGYEHSVERMQEKVNEGYSIAVFPEGTRTYDGKMKRFHKGAFYLAETLQLDIIPVLFYGNGAIISKAQPFNVRKGLIYTQILPRISYQDTTYGRTYQERTKHVSTLMKRAYAEICATKNNTDNPSFYESLVQNYIYKGPVLEWYIRIKVKMEDNYKFFDALIPRQGEITDIGCGYGPLCYMLALLSEKRLINGIDYDEDKIAVAQHGWLRNERIRFTCADAMTCPLPESDVFILNDILHYISHEEQRLLLLKCSRHLRPGGMIIVRDGNTTNKKRHRLTRFTEWLSTRIVNFNKTTVQLCFTSEKQIQAVAKECRMSVESSANDRYTSNTIYIFRPLHQNNE